MYMVNLLETQSCQILFKVLFHRSYYLFPKKIELSVSIAQRLSIGIYIKGLLEIDLHHEHSIIIC